MKIYILSYVCGPLNNISVKIRKNKWGSFEKRLMMTTDVWLYNRDNHQLLTAVAHSMDIVGLIWRMEMPLPIAFEYYIWRYLVSGTKRTVSTLAGVVDAAPQTRRSRNEKKKNKKLFQWSIIIIGMSKTIYKPYFRNVSLVENPVFSQQHYLFANIYAIYEIHCSVATVSTCHHHVSAQYEFRMHNNACVLVHPNAEETHEVY